MQKYTKADLVDLISAKSIVANFNLSRPQIREFMKIYEDSVYELLSEGFPVSFGNVGIFKYATICAKEERKNYLKYGGDTLPAHEAYSKIKFQPSKSLTRDVTKNSLGNPYNTKHTKQEGDIDGY